MVPLAGQADHRGSGVGGQLHGDRADAACGAGHHDVVARPERDRADHRIGRDSRHEQGAGRLPGDTGRLGHEVVRIDHDELGLAGPVIRPPEHLVTDREPGDAVAQLIHDAGQVAALPRRERGRPSRQQPPADLGLARVDPGCLHRDQDLTRAGHRTVDLLDVENICPAVPVEPDGLRHVRTPLSGAGDHRNPRRPDSCPASARPCRPLPLAAALAGPHRAGVRQENFRRPAGHDALAWQHVGHRSGDLSDQFAAGSRRTARRRWWPVPRPGRWPCVRVRRATILSPAPGL